MTTGAKLIALVVAGVVLFIAANAILHFDPFHWTEHKLVAAQTDAAQATGDLKVAGAQEQAATGAATVIDKGAERERRTAAIREANHDAIQKVPGGDEPMGVDLMRHARVGLCDYAAYRDDPGCGEVRGIDPAVIP